MRDLAQKIAWEQEHGEFDSFILSKKLNCSFADFHKAVEKLDEMRCSQREFTFEDILQRMRDE